MECQCPNSWVSIILLEDWHYCVRLWGSHCGEFKECFCTFGHCDSFGLCIFLHVVTECGLVQIHHHLRGMSSDFYWPHGFMSGDGIMHFIIQPNKCTTYIYIHINNILYNVSTLTCFNISASSSESLYLVLAKVTNLLWLFSLQLSRLKYSCDCFCMTKSVKC